MGTILLPGLLLLAPRILGTPAFVFGWAKPVPVDFRRLGHPRRDTVLVALAGPGTNLLLAALSVVVLRVLPDAPEAGSLAGGLAHDVNNMLTVISGSSQLLLIELPSNAESRTDAVEIHQAAQRAAKLIRQLLMFLRQ